MAESIWTDAFIMWFAPSGPFGQDQCLCPEDRLGRVPGAAGRRLKPSPNGFVRLIRALHLLSQSNCGRVRPAAGVPLQKSRSILGRVVAGYALDTADGPLIAAEHRMLFPFGERRLRKETRLHRHVVLDDDFLAANWLADGAESMAHDGNDGDLHWLSTNVLSRNYPVHLYGRCLDRSQPHRQH